MLEAHFFLLLLCSLSLSLFLSLLSAFSFQLLCTCIFLLNMEHGIWNGSLWIIIEKRIKQWKKLVSLIHVSWEFINNNINGSQEAMAILISAKNEAPKMCWIAMGILYLCVNYFFILLLIGSFGFWDPLPAMRCTQSWW